MAGALRLYPLGELTAGWLHGKEGREGERRAREGKGKNTPVVSPARKAKAKSHINPWRGPQVDNPE